MPEVAVRELNERLRRPVQDVQAQAHDLGPDGARDEEGWMPDVRTIRNLDFLSQMDQGFNAHVEVGGGHPKRQYRTGSPGSLPPGARKARPRGGTKVHVKPGATVA